MKYFYHNMIFVGSLMFFVVLPTVAAAQTTQFVPLANIPGVEPGQGGVAGYLNALYIILISVGALFAVLKIALAGIQYITNDIITSKEQAKKDIYGALLGLMIILSTTFVLYFIYPNLTSLNLFSGAQGDPPQSATQNTTIRSSNTSSGSASQTTPECPSGKKLLMSVNVGLSGSTYECVESVPLSSLKSDGCPEGKSVKPGSEGCTPD